MKRLLHCTLFLALTGLISTLLTGISPDTAHSAASDEDANTDDTDIRFMRILSIKIQVEMDDQHGEFMGLRSGYYPYTKGEFDGIAKGKLGEFTTVWLYLYPCTQARQTSGPADHANETLASKLIPTRSRIIV